MAGHSGLGAPRVLPISGTEDSISASHPATEDSEWGSTPCFLLIEQTCDGVEALVTS